MSLPHGSNFRGRSEFDSLSADLMLIFANSRLGLLPVLLRLVPAQSVLLLMSSRSKCTERWDRTDFEPLRRELSNRNGE